MRALLWQMAINVVDPLGLWRFVLVQPNRIVAGLIRRSRLALPSAAAAQRRRSPSPPKSAQPPAIRTKTTTTTTATSPISAEHHTAAVVARRNAGETGAGAESPAMEFAYRATLLTLGAAALIWTAVFMYLTFYYTYMPAVEHVHPVHMQYECVSQ